MDNTSNTVENRTCIHRKQSDYEKKKKRNLTQLRASSLLEVTPTNLHLEDHPDATHLNNSRRTNPKPDTSQLLHVTTFPRRVYFRRSQHPTRLTHTKAHAHTHTCTSSGHAERRTHKHKKREPTKHCDGQLVRGPHVLEYCRITFQITFRFFTCLHFLAKSGLEWSSAIIARPPNISPVCFAKFKNTSQSRLVICERSAGHVFAARSKTVLLPWASQATWPSVRSHCAPHLNRVNCALSHRVCHTSCEEMCSLPLGRVCVGAKLPRQCVTETLGEALLRRRDVLIPRMAC